MAESKLESALSYHRAGDLAAAEELYVKHLADKPDDSEALHLYGVLKHQAGRSADGRELVARAVAIAPQVAAYRANLGMIAAALGDNVAALDAFAAACTMQPELEAAVLALRAGCALAAGRFSLAAADYAQLAQAAPENVDAWRGLALARHAGGDPRGALPAYRRALDRRPDDLVAENGLGAALLETGNGGEALAVLERAAARARAPWGPLLANLGNARRAAGDLAGAIDALERAIACDPDNATTLSNLAAVFSEAGRLGDARKCGHRAVALAPDDTAARANLAACHFDAGSIGEAIAGWRALPDDRVAASNALYALNFRNGTSTADIIEASKRWAQRFTPSEAAIPVAASAASRDANRRLRIGFVSPDLRSHSVAWFLLPVLEAVDRSAFEIHAFAQLAIEDAITARLRTLFDRWCVTDGLDDDAMAAEIRNAGIDILVDLAGHTAGNRLGAFARRAAPVQLTWLGYPETTGMPSIGWRISDAIVEAPDLPSGPERALCLDGGHHCYRLPDGAPAIRERAAGPVVFGSFNNWPKHSPECLHLWAEIMSRVPGSRLILKNKAMADTDVRDAAAAFFSARGIGAERIEMLARIEDPLGHLALYGGIDIALDPFPYNGVTTTCEALSMGVPVMALEGATRAGRTAASILTHAECPELIARSPSAYAELAVALAGDRARIAAYRATLRARIQASALGNARLHAEALGTAFRSAWAAWCRENPAG
ncbi:MAG: tetratricopeptide repeat protein [Alphaproteobacteria bacterium]|nr:tetratricopeptide repeat protein [Alphaproteobacteria bacterium]